MGQNRWGRRARGCAALNDRSRVHARATVGRIRRHASPSGIRLGSQPSGRTRSLPAPATLRSPMARPSMSSAALNVPDPRASTSLMLIDWQHDALCPGPDVVLLYDVPSAGSPYSTFWRPIRVLQILFPRVPVHCTLTKGRSSACAQAHEYLLQRAREGHSLPRRFGIPGAGARLTDQARSIALRASSYTLAKPVGSGARMPRTSRAFQGGEDLDWRLIPAW